MTKHSFCACAMSLSLALVMQAPGPARASWPTGPTINVPLCAAAGDQSGPVAVSDGAGGAIVAWNDLRNGNNNSDVYAQHVTASGEVDPAWPASGRALCTAANHQRGASIVSDGAGGAIVTWEDFRSGDHIYAQHVLANGTIDPGWPVDGRALCTAADAKYNPTSVADGAGGAIAAWSDNRTGTYAQDLYAQRVLANGTVDPAWPTNGRLVCAAGGQQMNPTMVTDGANGAIITWIDYRSGPDIYAQHLKGNGVVDPDWPADGRGVCTNASYQGIPAIISDGAGGAIMTWDDYRNPTADIYAQRVRANGAVDPAWPVDGAAVCTAADSQYGPIPVSDGASGVIIAWRDFRNGNSDIYALRVKANGAVDPAWPVDGRALCTAAENQVSPDIMTDGYGGAIVVWSDGRYGSLYPTNYEIYAKRVFASGAVDSGWPIDGRGVCTDTKDQNAPRIIADGSGGGIVAWEDYRNTNGDIYAQRVQANGQLGGTVVDAPRETSLAFVLDAVRPNPWRGRTLSLSFSLPNDASATLQVIDIAGRRLAVRDLGTGTRGRGSTAIELRRDLAPGVYLVRLQQSGQLRARRFVVID